MNQPIKSWRNRDLVMAVDLQGDVLRYMHLKRAKRGLQCLHIGEHRLQGEKLAGSELEPHILKDAAHELSLSTLPVVMRLPLSLFRHHLIRLPVNNSSTVSRWLQDNLNRFLPSGMSPHQIVYSYERFKDGLLLTMARSEDIAKWTAIFRDLEMPVLAVCGGATAALTGFAFAELSFHEGCWACGQIDVDRLTLMITNKGDLVEYQELLFDSPDQDSPENARKGLWIAGRPWYGVMMEKIADFATEHSIERLVLSGPQVDKLDMAGIGETIAKAFGSALAVDVHTDEPDKNGLLFGLGVRGIYRDDNQHDMLSQKYLDWRTSKLQRVSTFHWSVVTSLALVAVWLLLMVARLFISHDLNRWGVEMAGLQHRINKIDSLRKEGRTLSEQLLEGQGVLSQGTEVAYTLSVLSQIMPEQVWLRSLEYGQSPKTDPSATHNPAIMIEGLAIDGQGPTRLLAQMERTQAFEKAKMQMMQAVSPDRVYKRTKIRREPLVQFKLSALIPTQ